MGDHMKELLRMQRAPFLIGDERRAVAAAIALADAVTRLHEAHDLEWGIMACDSADFKDKYFARVNVNDAVHAVLAARAALDAREG